MKNPKNNFTIIPNWLVDELSGAELKLYCKMYNGWCLMKDPDGWYYRSIPKLKEDLGISCKNKDKLIERIRKFVDLGILTIEKGYRKTNRYKFNEDYMFNRDDILHETCSTPEGYLTNEGSTPEGYEVVPQKGTSVVPQKGTLYNTVSNNTVKNNIYKEKKDKEKKESNTAGQGSLRNDGVSISSLTNEGNNFIQSEGKQDRQGDISTPKRSYGDVYWKVRKMIEKGKGFSEEKVRDYVNKHFILTGKVPQHEFEGDLAELQRLRDSMLDRESQDINTSSDLHVNKQTLTSSERSCQCTNEPYTSNNVKELQTMVDRVNLHPTEKRSERLESSAADLDNCVLSDDNLPNEQEYQNIEKCRQEAPYAILSNSGHSFTSEPMVMYGT